MGALRGRRMGVLALLAVVAFASVAVGQVLPEDGRFVPIKDTPCWDCHSGEAVPLRAFFSVIPPAEAVCGVPGVDEFPYRIEIQNAWLEDVVYAAPTLDLGGSPSLTFGGGPAPIVDARIEDVIPIEPTTITDEQTKAVQILIPGGASEARIALSPQGTGNTAPNLALRVFAPGAYPDTPFLDNDVDLEGNGGTEEVVLTTEHFNPPPDGGGYGNWTFEAIYDVVKEEGPIISLPPGEDVPFTITYSIDFNIAGLTALEQPTELLLEPQGRKAFTWNLRALSLPEGAQNVAIRVNGTGYYEHDAGDSDFDWGYQAAPEFILNVEAGEAGDVCIMPAEGNVIIRPPGNIPVSIDRISEAVGYFAAFLLISSIWSGGMFGKASRRQLNTLFGAAKRRVAFHNFLSYGLIAASIAHTVIFVIETQYYWTLGLIWGSLAILAMFGLGFTGALQVAMIRKWSYGLWRWTHYGMAVAAILFTVVHILLDGGNFGNLQQGVGWSDPLDPRDVAVAALGLL